MADHGDHGQERHVGGPSSLAVASLLALAGGFLVLSFTALAISITGLAVAAPLLLLCSPVLVPAALLVALEGIGMAASGALALGGIAPARSLQTK
nr:oleosin 18 kDa-like [Lolium perenne]